MMDLVFLILNDIQPGRLSESLIFLAVLWWKVRPHLKKIEERMEGMERGLKGIESRMSEGFRMGEERFQNLESRVYKLEGDKNA